MNSGRDHRRHAVRVAGVATGIVMAGYVIAATLLNLVVTDHLVGTIDTRLSDRLHDSQQQTLALPGTTNGATREGDVDEAPVFLWTVSPSGAVTAFDPGSPALPTHAWGNGTTTLSEGTSRFRFDSVQTQGHHLVAGQSMANVANVQSTLLVAELVFGALLTVAVFSGALVVGLRASAPSELVRQRQAEFTADASHELRTPISVMEAEVDLALSRPRDEASYREVLERLGQESRRLRHIVEDLLWLARADNDVVKDAESGIADVGEVVGTCVQRFSALAGRHGVSLDVRKSGDGPFNVQASAEKVDRLAGVLIENACKFAGEGGAVLVSVIGSGSNVSMRVEDSGPGIPPEEREAVFDRFHRGNQSVGGTGLGLAIADSVVRSTDGQWILSDSVLGGARMEVRWRRAAPRRGRPYANPDSAPDFTKSFN